MQTIPLAKICPIKTNFEQLISDEHPHSYILTPYFGIGIMRNLQMAMQLCISILFIDKWLCNFTFRFCSSTKWLCNFTFRFCSSTKWLCNFTFRFCSSTKWLCNFAIRFCSSTKWLCNFAMRSADFASYRYQLQSLFFSQSRISTIFALGRSS